MMKRIALILAFVLALGVFAGCTGDVVVYNNCTCPSGGHNVPPCTHVCPTVGNNPGGADAVKTGLAIMASVAKSKDGQYADYDVTLVAVLVDDQGIIRDCIIDSVGTKVNFDNTGAVTSELNAEIKTKNELGDDYGMLNAGAVAEWYQQADALAQFAIGKTVAQLKDGAIDETGKAPAGSDLASSATIYLGGYVAAIEKAVHNAKHLGAKTGDELKLASISSIASSKNAGEKDGVAQLDMDVTALTVKGGVITSCYIDALQAKVNFDTTGKITTDLSVAPQTKNELGDKYGMVQFNGAKYEWYVQAANFAAYVTGKTAAQVADIAVNEETKPTDTDLSASVTIAVGGFQALIAKALA